MRNTILGVVAVVIIATAAFLFFKGATMAPTVPPISNTSTLPSVTPEVESMDAVEVDNQIAGSTVIVKMVQLKNSGFVNIHEEADGAPGAVLGVSALLPQGTSTNVVVPVSPPTLGSKSYYAMLHMDNGDGKYEFPGPDVPLKDSVGNIVMKKFLATSNSGSAAAVTGSMGADVKVGTDLTQGSGDASGTASTGTTVMLTMNMDSGNFYFRPNTIQAKLNQPVTIKFNNSGFHTFTIDELGVNQTVSGSTGSVTFTPNKKGTFEFYCTVGNHRDLGQKGTITVE